MDLRSCLGVSGVVRYLLVVGVVVRHYCGWCCGVALVLFDVIWCYLVLLVVFVGYNKVFLVCWVLFITCCLLTWVLFWVGWGFLLVTCVITVLLALFGGYWSVIWCLLLVTCCLFVCLALVVGYLDILGFLFGLLVAWGFLGLIGCFLG